MGTQIITTIITGIFSILSGCCAILLKNYLEMRKSNRAISAGTSVTAEIPFSDNKNSNYKYSSGRLILIILIAFITGILYPEIKLLISNLFSSSSHDIHWDALITLIFLSIVNLIILVHYSRIKKNFNQLFYQLETLLLWSSYTCGWSLRNGSVWMDLVSVAIGFWLAAVVIGFIVLAITGSINK